jgi:hypothetical protein
MDGRTTAATVVWVLVALFVAWAVLAFVAQRMIVSG